MTTSRDYFADNENFEGRNYSGVEWQQGVPVMDADLNLAQQLRKLDFRRAVCDFLGNGAPHDGFRLSRGATDTSETGIVIHAGDIWIAGLKIELPEDITVGTQPHAANVTIDSGNGLWYLNVAERRITDNASTSEGTADADLRPVGLPNSIATPIAAIRSDWTLKKAVGTTDLSGITIG